MSRNVEAEEQVRAVLEQSEEAGEDRSNQHRYF